MTKITHMTSVHPRFDVRIYHKQVRSLVKAGYQVSLVVADGLGDIEFEGVRIIDCGQFSSRFQRFFSTQYRVYKACIKTSADLFHFHDPELLLSGLALRLRGAVVIFDSHEDVQSQILQKRYLPPIIARCLSFLYRVFEVLTVGSLSGVISVTSDVDKKFKNLVKQRAIVSNYPISDEFLSTVDWAQRECAVCYVGMITRSRGVIEIVRAVQLTKATVRLHLMGDFEDKYLRDEIKKIDTEGRVILHPHGNRQEVKKLLSRSMIGLCVLHPVQNHLRSLPNKMFEYMAAGIPVIVSDFPLWKKIIDESGAGLTVSVRDVPRIAECIDRVMASPKEAEQFGINGMNHVKSGQNWENEEKKLFSFYNRLLVSHSNREVE